MKVIRNFIGIVLTGAFFFVGACFVVHRSKVLNSFNDYKTSYSMKKYNTGEFRVNVRKIGDESSKYKIVVLSDYNSHDLSIQMKKLNEELSDDFEIIYVDRAGYGFSEDSTKEQNIERIVLAYRNALMNAGVTRNYILLANGYSSVYATYWEVNYPKNVAGVIYLDSRIVDGNTIDLPTDITAEDYQNLLLTKIGLHRLNLDKYYTRVPAYYGEKDLELSKELNASNTYSSAQLSEKKNLVSNQLKAFNTLKETEIPKLYIESSYGFRSNEELSDYINWYNEYANDVGLAHKSELTFLEKESIIENDTKYHEETIVPFTEKLGNTKIELLPGDNKIYIYKPKELGDIIKNFVSKELK